MKNTFLCAALVVLGCVSALGQSQYQVLYNFGANGPSDGNLSKGKLVFDEQGNLYGTTAEGGDAGVGTVFELSPAGKGEWTETILYSFCSQPECSDGSYPEAGLIFDSVGNLYGTTENGGTVWGTVFKLSPPSQGGPWIETVLYTFGGNTTGDGCYPEGKLLFDTKGNLYGTTSQCGGGSISAGTVFELTPVGDGTWQEVVLHRFCSDSKCRDGADPNAGVTFDTAGNLYGTTYAGGGGGGIGFGTVYELSPGVGGAWTESVLHVFGQNASHPMSAINMDESGNLYGTANSGGLGSQRCFSGNQTCGGVFKLTKVGGEWKDLLFQFDGQNGGNPTAGVSLAIQRNIAFGTTAYGGTGGTVYKFDSTKETVLYNFCSQPNCADGSVPMTALIADTSGHLYGTTQEGGPYGQGVVFEVTP
jgi:uncharacterized repeat protein (TIGR03803 family)